MRKTYAPMAGTIPYRAIAWLAENPGQHATAVIAEAIGCAPEGMSVVLAPAVQHRVVGRVKRDGRLYFWHAKHDPIPEPAALIETPDSTEDAGGDDLLHRIVRITPVGRWALWSDGGLVVERGESRVELTRDETKRLTAYLQKAQG